MNINALRFEQTRDSNDQPVDSMVAIHADPDMTLRDFMLRYVTQPRLVDFGDRYEVASNADVVIELRLPHQALTPKETP